MTVRSTPRPSRSKLRSASGGAALALIAASLALAGCGGGSDNDSPAPAPVPGPNQPPAPPPPPPAAGISASNQCLAYPTVAASGITGNLVAGVSNPQNRTLSFSVTSQPTRGTVAVAQNGAFTYLSTDKNRGFSDSFSYSVSDGQGGTAQATYRLIYGAARIMPMGDSITAGVETYDGTNGGDGPPDAAKVAYRYQLYQLLTQNGYAFDFVGRNSNGAGATPPLADPANEAYGGQPTDFLTDLLPAAFTAGQPDVVLLHIGTNDINGSTDTPTATPMQGLLTSASTWATANQPVQVMVARIIKFRTGTPGAERVAQLNTAVTTMIGQNFAGTTGALKVSQADFEGATIDMTPPAADVGGLHPSRAGYDQMAQVWFNQLVGQKLINKCD